MAIRIIALALITVGLIKMGFVATIPFFLFLIFYYIIHQIIEIGSLNKAMPKIEKKNEGERP